MINIHISCMLAKPRSLTNVKVSLSIE